MSTLTAPMPVTMNGSLNNEQRRYMEALREMSSKKEPFRMLDVRSKYNLPPLRDNLMSLQWVRLSQRGKLVWTGPHPRTEEELFRMASLIKSTQAPSSLPKVTKAPSSGAHDGTHYERSLFSFLVKLRDNGRGFNVRDMAKAHRTSADTGTVLKNMGYIRPIARGEYEWIGPQEISMLHVRKVADAMRAYRMQSPSQMPKYRKLKRDNPKRRMKQGTRTDIKTAPAAPVVVTRSILWGLIKWQSVA